MSDFRLTELEKAALLKKADLAPSLSEARKIHLQEMEGLYDSEKTPEGRWDETTFLNSREGRVGCKGYNQVFRISLSGRKFTILHKWKQYVTNPEKVINNYYVFVSGGEDIDRERISRDKLMKLLNSSFKHLPESLDMLKEEIERLRKPVKKCFFGFIHGEEKG